LGFPWLKNNNNIIIIIIIITCIIIIIKNKFDYSGTVTLLLQDHRTIIPDNSAIIYGKARVRVHSGNQSESQ